MICFVYAVVAHLSSAEMNKSTVEICEKGGSQMMVLAVAYG
jgi:hypothetical protein